MMNVTVRFVILIFDRVGLGVTVSCDHKECALMRLNAQTFVAEIRDLTSIQRCSQPPVFPAFMYIHMCAHAQISAQLAHLRPRALAHALMICTQAQTHPNIRTRALTRRRAHP